MFFYDVCHSLHERKIPFAVVGGYALAMHGIVRATMDVDLVINLSADSFQSAEKCLNQLGLKSRLPVRSDELIKMREEYIENRNLIAWSFVDYDDPTKQVDILLTEDFRKIEKQLMSFDGKKIYVASLKAILKMKKASARPQDLIDIQKINEVLNGKK